MKKFYTSLLVSALAVATIFSAKAQSTNTFPVSGNVGIGITSPTYKLQVEGITRTTALSLSGRNGGYSANGFNNTIEFTGLPHAALVYNPGMWNELMFGLHSNGYFYWGTGRAASKPDFYSMELNGNTGDLRIGGRLTATSMEVNGPAVIDGGYLYTGRGAGELNRYVRLLNSYEHSSASGLMAGGMLISDSYSYANPGKNDLVVKGKIGIGTPTSRAGLEINRGNTNDLALMLSSSGPGWGSGVILENTAGAGSSYGMYVSPDGNLYLTNEKKQVANWVINQDGNFGIGTRNLDPAFKLSVNGAVRAKEVKVESNWADFVFEPDYKLRSLEEVEAHIKAHGHLPEVPTAAVVKREGVDLGKTDALLLQKIEELTLYMIEMKKEIRQLKEENQQLKGQLHR